jgi:ribosomal protein L37E
MSIAHDDRLGLYYIMDILPSLGVNVDVLLTTDEEVGQSSASEFLKAEDKQYNWMFMFDRHGFGNVVMYQYETQYAVKLLENVGYDVQVGTFSDISELDHMGCLGFNFGVGYVNEHSHQCRTRVSWMNVCLNMFVDFWKLNCDMYMPYVPKPTKRWNKGFSVGKIHGGTSATTDIVPLQGSSWGHGKLTDKRCVRCGVNLYQDEDQICFDCDEGFTSAVDAYGTPDIPFRDPANPEVYNCKYCSLPYAAEDLNDMGVCYDCAEFIDRLDESNDRLAGSDG